MSETQKYSLLPGDRLVWDAVRPTEIQVTQDRHIAPPVQLQNALRARDAEVGQLREQLKARDRTISDMVEAAEDAEESEAPSAAELVMTQYLLNGAQEREQIFEAMYEYEKRSHERTREELGAAFELLGVQQERMEWLLGGEWPGEHGVLETQ